MLRLLLVLLVACALSSCQKRADPPQQPPTETNSLLVRVAPQNVCMANNRFMAEPQIPVVVQDKTYYGCCPMCEQRLRDEPAIRTAKDPVSGRRVDKATAIIGKLASGNVLYFESEKTFAAYHSGA